MLTLNLNPIHWHLSLIVQVLVVPLADVLSVLRVADPSLPEGAALRVQMRDRQVRN